MRSLDVLGNFSVTVNQHESTVLFFLVQIFGAAATTELAGFVRAAAGTRDHSFNDDLQLLSGSVKANNTRKPHKFRQDQWFSNFLDAIYECLKSQDSLVSSSRPMDKLS